MYSRKKLVMSLAIGAASFCLFSGFAYAAKGTTSADSVCLREKGTTEAVVLKTLSKGVSLEILDRSGQWVKASLNGTIGWIHKDLIKQDAGSTVSADIAYVKAEGVNLREGGGKDFGTVGTLSKGARVTIVQRGNYWYKIKTESGKLGWVKKEFVSSKKNLSASISRGGEDRESNLQDFPAGADVASTAKDYLGRPYVYGANGPGSFDCSGFTKFVFAKHGICLERVADGQSGQGQRVSRSELETGDLVFFRTEGSSIINHVGVYIGNNEFIHASSGSGGVIRTSLDGYYDDHYAGARRVRN